jgi:uncharacterized protein YggE
MKRFGFMLCILVCAVANGQSYANYQYSQDRKPDNSPWPNGTKSFTSTADIIIYVPPDGWIIELQGNEEAPTLEQARLKIQTRIDAFTKKLNANGISSADITVTSVSQERIKGWKSDGKGGSVYTTISYSLIKNMLIHYSDPKKYNTIITEASVVSFDNVQQSYCTVGDEQAVYAELYRHAMEVVLQKQSENIQFYNANPLPDAYVSYEDYDVITPNAGVYVQPGNYVQPAQKYDRSIGTEYGTGAVRYVIHLQYTYTLQKQNKIQQPNVIKK